MQASSAVAYVPEEIHHLKAVNNTPVPVLGRALVRLEYGKKVSFLVDFLVASRDFALPCDAILGLSFLDKYECLLDARNGRLISQSLGLDATLLPLKKGAHYSLYGLSWACSLAAITDPASRVSREPTLSFGATAFLPDCPTSKERTLNEDYAVFVKKDVVLGSHMERTFWAHTDAPRGESYGCQPVYDTSLSPCFLANSLVTVDEEGAIPVHALNVTDTPWVYKAGTVIASLYKFSVDAPDSAAAFPHACPAPGDADLMRPRAPPALQINAVCSSLRGDSPSSLAPSGLESPSTHDVCITTELAKVRLTHLAAPHRSQVRALLWKYKKLFDVSSMGGSPNFVARIRPRTSEPLFSPQYRLPEPQRAFLCKEIPKLLDQGILEFSDSVHNSPVLCVRKPRPEHEHDYRLVTDFRKVNKALVNTVYAPIPRIDELLDSLQGAAVFSSLDLRSSFHLLRVHPKDRKYLAFTPPCPDIPRVQYTSCPMGLITSSFHLVLHLQKILFGLMGKTCAVYLDDILVYSEDMKTHIERLDGVLSRLHADNLRLSAHKCEIARASLCYLGFVISAGGILPDPQKTAPLRRVKRLYTVKELKSFLGLVQFYAAHCPGLWQAAYPLQKNLRKDAKWEWGPSQEMALDYIIRTLTESPALLHFPDSPASV